MPRMTRRSLIHTGGLSASAVTLLAAANANTAMAEEQEVSVFHAFAFQWKPEASEAQKDRATREIAAFQGQIPGLLQTHVGPNISPRGKGYTFVGILQLDTLPLGQLQGREPGTQFPTCWTLRSYGSTSSWRETRWSQTHKFPTVELSSLSRSDKRLRSLRTEVVSHRASSSTSVAQSPVDGVHVSINI
jgi:hypothetical protein